jgi:hypothetical protein
MERTSTEHEVSSYFSVTKWGTIVPNEAAQIWAGVYATTTPFKDIPVHDERHQLSKFDWMVFQLTFKADHTWISLI